MCKYKYIWNVIGEEEGEQVSNLIYSLVVHVCAVRSIVILKERFEAEDFQVSSPNRLCPLVTRHVPILPSCRST